MLTDDDFAVLASLRSTRVFAKTLHEILNDTARDGDSCEDKIKDALYAQVAARDEGIIERRLKDANLHTSIAALERFDTTGDRGITQDRIDRLNTCDWINYGQDLIIIGATGTGKSYLAQAVGIAACRKKMTASYWRMNDLADEFDARASLPAQRKDFLDKLARPSVVIIDDFLTTEVSHYALNQVFNLLVKRENSSTVLASQTTPDSWYTTFNNAAVADAVLSRLSNDGLALTLKGDDMRAREDLQKERRTTIKKNNDRQPRKQ